MQTRHEKKKKHPKVAGHLPSADNVPLREILHDTYRSWIKTLDKLTPAFARPPVTLSECLQHEDDDDEEKEVEHSELLTQTTKGKPRVITARTEFSVVLCRLRTKQQPTESLTS